MFFCKIQNQYVVKLQIKYHEKRTEGKTNPFLEYFFGGLKYKIRLSNLWIVKIRLRQTYTSVFFLILYS